MTISIDLNLVWNNGFEWKKAVGSSLTVHVKGFAVRHKHLLTAAELAESVLDLLTGTPQEQLGNYLEALLLELNGSFG